MKFNKLVVDLSGGCILSVLYTTRCLYKINIAKVFQSIKSIYDCKWKSLNELSIYFMYGVVRICESGLIQFFISKRVLYFITHKDQMAKRFLNNLGIFLFPSLKKGQVIYKKKTIDDKLLFINKLIQTFDDIKMYARESHDLESIFIPVSIENIELTNRIVYRFTHQRFVLTITISGCVNVLCYKFKTLSMITRLLNQ